MKINQENVKEYINYESGVPTYKLLQSSLIMCCIIGIPSSLFGKYSNITKIILLPCIVIFCLWTIYQLIYKNINREHFILYLGVTSFFTSFLFMIAAYKFALMAYNVTIEHVLFIIIIFVIINSINILNVLRLIKKGYYKKKGRNENPSALFIAVSVCGLSMGKLFINTKQENVIAILVSLLLFMAILFTTGTHNFLKYYYIKKLLRVSQLDE